MNKQATDGNAGIERADAVASDDHDCGHGISRRNFIKGAGGAAIALSAPFVITRARAATQVVCRNPGGAYGDALQAAYYTPFTKATGIEVVGVPASAGKLLPQISETRPLDPALARRLDGRYGEGAKAVDLSERNGRLYYLPARGGEQRDRGNASQHQATKRDWKRRTAGHFGTPS